MKIRTLIVGLCLGLLPLGGTAIQADADAVKGEKLFKKCRACHQVGSKAKHRTGPVLNQIVGAAAGEATDFKYSKALLKAADEGLVWTPENLDLFLEKPKKFIPRTKMKFNGLKKKKDRDDLIAYLATFSIQEQSSTGFSVSDEILALKGDVEYGEYLSSECTTCHQASGDNDGIPSIVGLDLESFVTAMHAYKTKHRDNQVMQLVSNRLSDEEIAALAAYFQNLEN